MPKMVDDLNEEYVRGTDWWSRIIVLIVIALNVVFIIEILDIYREYQTEPYALIGMVTALSVGEFSILYFIYRNRKEVVRETIRYDRDYEMISGGRTHEAKMATDKQKHDAALQSDKQSNKNDVEFCSREEIGMVNDLDDVFNQREG